jgi:hypothetical protein
MILQVTLQPSGSAIPARIVLGVVFHFKSDQAADIGNRGERVLHLKAQWPYGAGLVLRIHYGLYIMPTLDLAVGILRYKSLASMSHSRRPS